MTSYVPPKPYVGQIVQWAQDGQTFDAPAVVTKVGSRTLNVTVIADGFYELQPKNGVFHIDDPDRKNNNNQVAGFWDFVLIDKPVTSLSPKAAIKLSK